MKQKRLLIIGAGRGQIGLYKAAKELGFWTIAGTMPTNTPPGIALADEVCYMNIANVEDVVEKARSLNLNGVATSCMDTGIQSVGAVCDALKLTGITAGTAAMCNDKFLMKQRLCAYDIPTATYYRVSSLEEVVHALNVLRLPVIVKAVDLQGSNGVYIARTKEEAVNAYQEVMKRTHKDSCLIEEFIEGNEFGAQAFVYDNKILFVMPHGDEMYKGTSTVPIGHYVPFSCSEDMYNQIVTIVIKSIQALGLNNCAVNVDLIERDGKVYIIELTGRVGANCLPELVSIHFGIDYYEMIVLMAMGEDPMRIWAHRQNSHKAGLARMIFETEEEGYLDSIDIGKCNADYIEDITFFKKSGDMITTFKNSNDCIGQIVVSGNSLLECRRYMDRIIGEIDIKLK